MRCLCTLRDVPNAHRTSPLVSRGGAGRLRLPPGALRTHGMAKRTALKGRQLATTAPSEDASRFPAALHAQGQPLRHGACLQVLAYCYDAAPETPISLPFDYQVRTDFRVSRDDGGSDDDDDVDDDGAAACTPRRPFGVPSTLARRCPPPLCFLCV